MVAAPARTALPPLPAYAAGTAAGPTGNRCIAAAPISATVSVTVAGCPPSIESVIGTAAGAALGTTGAVTGTLVGALTGWGAARFFGMTRNITIPAPATTSAAHIAIITYSFVRFRFNRRGIVGPSGIAVLFRSSTKM